MEGGGDCNIAPSFSGPFRKMVGHEKEEEEEGWVDGSWSGTAVLWGRLVGGEGSDFDGDDPREVERDGGGEGGVAFPEKKFEKSGRLISALDGL